jgi:DNA-directed RNA polymerase specialized sigma24 family protein
MSVPTIALPPEQLRELAEMIVSIQEERSQKVATTYTYKEVATILKVSADTVRRRVDAGTYKRVPGISKPRISHQELTRILS